MIKGFKDSKGKFRPTEKKNGVPSKNVREALPKSVTGSSFDKMIDKDQERLRSQGKLVDIELGERDLDADKQNTGRTSPKDLKEKKEQSLEQRKIGEYELSDILQEVTPQTLAKVAEENIEFTLKREKQLPKGHSVLVPFSTGVVDFRFDTEDEGGFYQVDFEIFDDKDNVTKGGTAFGTISNAEMIDMTVELFHL